ncbi:MAG: long-chain fatty-acid-CoA ligase [Symbiobacteriaceae bacterium]|jgi:long-chain acyl-CoA synthetase|nr:long-chain fatty-acid-CoA ligase [Symbiobacteriaceae bacterium]
MDRPWLKAYPAGVRPHLEYPQVPAYHYLFEQIRQYPDRTALLFFGKKVSYKQLGEQIDRFAQGLIKRMGVRKGDRVGIILPNCPQNVIATVGCQRAGAIPVQFNPMYVSREIAYQVRDAGCKIMITLDLFWPKVKEAGGAEAYVVTGMPDYLPFPLNFLFPLKTKAPKVGADEAVRFMDLLKEDASTFKPVGVKWTEEPAVLMYTGGTTGTSKGVMLTHYNLAANIAQIKEWLQRPENGHDTVLVVLPMFHSYGMTAALGYALATGSTCILVPKFDAKEILKLIQKYRPNSFPGVPTIYTALLHDPDITKYDLSSVEFCVSGAAPLPVELMQKFEQVTGSSILEGYGLTETSPVTHSNPMKGRRVPGSVGLPYADTDVRIIDLETGEDVPLGQEGEVLLRGPQVMKGYWNKPEETAEILKDGWLYTGDIGKMDEDGYLYIVDRKKDMIIAGGFNIYPREIDEILFQHPAVLEACSVGLSDEYRGETVKAFVVLKPGATATEQEILDFCKERLAAYKRPKAVEFIEALPKSTVGKVLRRVLAEREKEKARVAATTEKPWKHP